jgi:hypothetical protein
MGLNLRPVGQRLQNSWNGLAERLLLLELLEVLFSVLRFQRIRLGLRQDK